MEKKRYAAKSTIGLRDLCYAMLTETDAGHIYGPVRQVAGAIDATITPNPEFSNQYADDGTYDTYSALGDITIGLELAGLPDEVQVDWLGFRIDANGVLIKDKDAQGGYLALGFRSLMSNNKFRYVWAYKCKASIPEESSHTKEGNGVTFTTRSVELNCSPREKDGKWQAVVTEGAEGVNAETVKTFLDAPYEEVSAVGP